MNQNKYIDDLNDIKNMMSKSSRFLSLSGLSGISAGIVGLAAAFVAYMWFYTGENYNTQISQIQLTSETWMKMVLLGLTSLILALGLGIFFTIQKTKQSNEKIWTIQTKRLLVNLGIPLVAGGLLCLILLSKGLTIYVAPMTLIFYGLALINASKYTVSEIRSLGIIEIVLGLFGAYFTGYGLILWAVGFGIMHIIYGIKLQMNQSA